MVNSRTWPWSWATAVVTSIVTAPASVATNDQYRPLIEPPRTPGIEHTDLYRPFSRDCLVRRASRRKSRELSRLRGPGAGAGALGSVGGLGLGLRGRGMTLPRPLAL